jgi:hypothetical protein
MAVLFIDCRDSRERKDLLKSLEEGFLDWDLVALYCHLGS